MKHLKKIIAIILILWVVSGIIRLHDNRDAVQCHIRLCEEAGYTSSIVVDSYYLYELPTTHVNCRTENDGFVALHQGEDLDTLCHYPSR